MPYNGSLSNNLPFRKNTFIIILTFNILHNINFNKTRLLDNLSRFIGSLTARQYVEVVLPDAASGHPPAGGLVSCLRRDQKAVTVQGGYAVPRRIRRLAEKSGAHFLPSRYKFY